MAQFVPGSAAQPVSEVELTISCRDLNDLDVFSKSDPMCVVFYKTFEEPQWKEICRTETIYNNLNPDFSKKVQLKYHFEEVQKLRFDVYDVDSQSHSLQAHDFLGTCETTLGLIVSSGQLTLALSGVEHCKGKLLVCAEELNACHDEVLIQFHGRNIQKQCWLGKLDPFYEVSKAWEDGTYRLVFRSEALSWTSSPQWQPFCLPVRELCGGDLERSLKVRCFDWHRSGSHKFIGEFFINLRKLSEGPEPGSQTVFPIINPRKKETHSDYINSGEFVLVRFKLSKIYSFLDYIGAGMQLNCTVAIDFTASNGSPSSPSSLHYISGGANQYEQALTAVGEIIADYDSDKLFPVLGFGARVPPSGNVSHEFYVNLHPSNPYCEGISGILEAYKACLAKVQLYGPTNFAPVINHVARFAQVYQDGSNYFILLIITDGVISDMPQAKEAIVDASRLPMSIIIVGVGQADFAAMDELDADTIPLEYNGKKAERDIVQFVPFRNFQNLPKSDIAKAYLAREVLAEIPQQIVGYMKSGEIVPGKFKSQQNLPPER